MTKQLDTAKPAGQATEITASPQTWDELVTWLAAISPIPRAKLLGLLVDAQNAKQLAAMRRAAVAEASTGRGSAAEVAAQLGVSVHAVYKATKEHNKASAAGGQGAPPSAGS